MHEVLRIIARMNVGGPARHVIRIAAPLERRGWHSVLVTGRASPHEGELIDEARAAGLEVLVMDDLGRELHPWRDARALHALRRLLRERRPALVHTHTAKAGVLGRLAARSLSPRPGLVHTYHGHVLSGYFPAPVAALFRAAERALARSSDRLIAVAPQVRDELLARHGVGRPAQYEIIPPGVDAARTVPDREAGKALRAALGWSAEHVVTGCVGRMAAIKRVDSLLDAWPAVRARAPHARLLIVGSGPLERRLRRRVSALPGAAWLPARSDLRPVYGALDVLALPSAREGLPQVLVEALLAGLPVVACAVGGVPELIAHGEQGLLVPPGDATALAAALAVLSNDARLREACAARARACALDAHTASAVAERLADLYCRVMQARREPRLENAPAETQTRAACTSSS